MQQMENFVTNIINYLYPDNSKIYDDTPETFTQKIENHINSLHVTHDSNIKCTIVPQHIEEKIIEKLKGNIDLIRKLANELREYRKLNQTKAQEHTFIESRNLEKNEIYNMHNRKKGLPGKFLSNSRDQSILSSDKGCIVVWDSTNYFLKFCTTILERNSIDGRGFSIDSSIHFFYQYNNAFYNGRQMVYGDGDQIVFSNFDCDPTVIYHELFHGVTDHTCGFEYQDESGALNEHLSDVFSCIIDQWVNNTKIDEAQWVIGDICMVDIEGKSYSLRSLADPGSAYINHPYMGTDDQPSTYDEKYTGKADNGGVHINSGIPNYAFYLFCKAIGGVSWTIPCKIWYTTITNPGKVHQKCTFKEFAEATINVAGELYSDSSIVDKLLNAWTEVKILS